MSIKQKKSRVLIADDDRIQSRLISHWLQKEGFEVAHALDGRECLDLLDENVHDVLLLDVHMPRLDGLGVLERLEKLDIKIPVIMLTQEVSVETIVRSMRLGAYDYLSKPVDRLKLLPAMERAIEHGKEQLDKLAMSRQIKAIDGDSPPGYGAIISGSEVMESLFRELDRLVHYDVSVLIHGPSGSGKELVARAIHDHSRRAKGGAFVPVNCAAVPASLQESAFFGHERGAFTGAETRHIGHFEQANGGTIFLDEVAELSPELQASLLRVLQEKTVQRLGSTETVKLDVRVVAASHKQLDHEVSEGRFRQDLYYRLAVYEVEVPPLRERPEDIQLLARHFLDQITHEAGRAPLEFSARASDALARYSWPGNVRELKNAMQRAAIMAQEAVEVAHLPRKLKDELDLQDDAPQEVDAHSVLFHGDDILPLSEVERLAILHAHKKTDGNVSESARRLGISRAKLYRRLKAYGLVEDEDASGD